jgi:RNA polymerase sigma factor (TIGR02999 family)
LSDLQRPDGLAPGEVTALLDAARGGDEAARRRLFDLVYEELKLLARRHLRRAGPSGTLQTTALVHEAYLRLARPGAGARDRAHFFAVASCAMRHILIDHARARARRPSGIAALEPDHLSGPDPRGSAERILAVDEALGRLELLDRRLGQVVEMHFFGGLSFAEIGELLDVSERTVKRDWRRARAFLQSELAPES